MNCPKCQTQNEEIAQFCRNCGTNIHYFLELQTTDKTSDLLVLTFLVIMFVGSIGRYAIQQLVDSWYEVPTKYIIGGLNLIVGISVILLVISLSNKTIKIFGLILASIYSVFILYTNIVWLLK